MSNRRRATIFAATLLVVVGLTALVFWNSLTISYHHWRMNSAYNTLFGNPQPTGNGLASNDVTDIDVESVIKTYESHRTTLVGLGALHHAQFAFPNLAANGTIERSILRSDFADRMWQRFPNHKHYYLADDGSFETWIPIDAKNEWNKFEKSELARSKSAERINELP
jgi:hypothetical protein